MTLGLARSPLLNQAIYYKVQVMVMMMVMMINMTIMIGTTST